MSRAWLLAAVSLLALSAPASEAAERDSAGLSGDLAHGNAPKPAKILYNQNSDGTGSGINSQNFTSGGHSSGNDAGADDFVVPEKTQWTVTEVDVTGFYPNGSGAKSENVIFYQNHHGVPGKAVTKGRFKGLVGTDRDGSFAIKLPGQGISLKPGTYWVSVVANCTLTLCGQWDWETTGTIHGNQAVWQEPEGKVCPSWGTIEDCLNQSGDLMFDLRGTNKGN